MDMSKLRIGKDEKHTAKMFLEARFCISLENNYGRTLSKKWENMFPHLFFVPLPQAKDLGNKVR
jgi:hypothetical protein